MKRFLSLLLFGVLALLPCLGCGGGEGDNGGDGGNEGEEAKEEILLLDTCNQTVLNLSGTDSLGRAISPATGNRDRLVGMFYFTWNGQERKKQYEIYDNTKLMAELGDEFWADYGTFESPADQFHYWGEPLFGYYNAMDPWVLCRHMEMLTMAGIDFLVFDATNQFIYSQVWNVLFPIMEEFQEQGFAVPKIMFYTNTDSPNRIEQLYIELYQPGKFKDLWFMPNGKPLVISADKAGSSKEIRDFFEFRTSQWPGMPESEDGFPWIDFNRPQKVFAKGGPTGGSIMSVSVSQHPGWPFSDSVRYKDVSNGNGGTYYNDNWGRGYTAAEGNNPDKVLEGANFQEQWNYALEADPSTVFVTGWNEWIAVKFYEDITITTGVTSRPNIPDRRVFFVDTVNMEFSRDIEPMKGGYGDNFYMQLIQNIRTYKGVSGEIAAGQKLTIDINGDLKQWESVTSSFRDFVGDSVVRNYANAAETGTYTDNSARNDISEIRMAYDDDNLYILVTADKAITAHEADDLSWMNVLLGVQGIEASSFGDYQFVINRKPSNGTTSVERSTGGYNFETIGEAQMKVSGKYLQIAVTKSLLGITEGFTLLVKATDHITVPGDFMDYYVSGDSAPIGRLSYTFRG